MLDFKAQLQKNGLLRAEITCQDLLVPTDNIPGVSGIGEKGALELLRQFDTLEKMLDSASEVISHLPSSALDEQGLKMSDTSGLVCAWNPASLQPRRIKADHMKHERSA